MSPSSPPYQPPDFGARSALVGRADRFAFDAHEGARSRGETRIDHPRAVAALLADRTADDEILAAALLHDVLEDTNVTYDELQAAFGARVSGLVAGLSEDPAIEPYAERKSHLRRQVAGAGPDTAAIFLADKLAKLQALERSGSPIDPQKLRHYRATLDVLSRAHPEAPFIPEVSEALTSAVPG